MRPLSNQSASTFLPHAVAASAGLAVAERGERAQGEHERRDERAQEAGGCHERDLMGRAGSLGAVESSGAR